MNYMRYIVESFDMAQPGSVTDRCWILLYIMPFKCSENYKLIDDRESWKKLIYVLFKKLLYNKGFIQNFIFYQKSLETQLN